MTVIFFAKEGEDCNLTPMKESILPLVTLPFEQGLGQKFRQPSGTGIDFSMFEESELMKVDEVDIYHLAVKAEALPVNQNESDENQSGAMNSQITQAVFEKEKGEYHTRVVKQILWVNGMRYELQEIYGIGNSVDNDVDANDRSSDPTNLIRSATPVSSLLKASSVVHVDYVNEFTLVVFKKKPKPGNNANFEHYSLPSDCPSVKNNKAVLDNLEPLLKDKPIQFEKSTAYLPMFVNVSSKQRLVYIEIGAGEHLNSNVTSWFLPSYPVDYKAFDVYFVDRSSIPLINFFTVNFFSYLTHHIIV